MATDNFWGTFRRWRRHRPFWGGLLLILSAVELFLSANLTVGGIEVHLGPQGFLSYLLPALLLVSGLLIWITPAQRLFYAIVALLTALYTFLGLNLGGFFIGMLLGIVGGALVIAWGPPRPKPGTGLKDAPSGEPGDHDEDIPEDAGDEIFGERAGEDIEQTQQIEVAGHDDRQHDGETQPVRPATQSFSVAPAAPRPRLGRLGRNRKALVLAFVPVAITATVLVAGSNLPASAEECPEGLPSRSTSATSATATTAATTTAATTTAAAAAAAADKTTAAAEKTTATATATSGSEESGDDDSSGNAIVDGIDQLIDGVSNLLGIDDESSSPSASPSPSESTTETADPEPTATTTKPSDDETTTKPSDDETTTSASTTTSESVEPTASGSEIPCLGARVYGKVASADDVPDVAAEPGLMEVDSLTMYNSTYDGVVDMPQVGGGTYRALKFSMDKAVNKPFSLTIDEPNGGTTVITSNELTTTGTVRFYTTEFKGNLFGLIPITFTPDDPPPLTLPVLWFTDAKIQLAYVRSDTLTGDPLKVEG